MNDKKLTILLSSLVIIFILIIIGYPTVKLYQKEKNYTRLKNDVNNIVTEVNKLYNSNNLNTDYDIYTIKNYKIVEEGLTLESNLPENGYIYLTKDGKVKVIANTDDYCILKDYDNNIYSNVCDSLQTVNVANLNVELSYDGDGLYSNFDGDYYYKGKDPNNYIEIDNELYRIIKINKDKNIIIIKNDYFEKKNYKDLENILFDVNNDLKYKNYRTNINFEEKQYFSYNFENKNKNFTSNIISFINVQDYINVSLDTKCKNNLENIKNCKNSNWLNTSYPYITRDYDGQGVIQISSNGILEKANLDDDFNIRFVFTINSNIKLNGQGTFEKPYKIVI